MSRRLLGMMLAGFALVIASPIEAAAQDAQASVGSVLSVVPADAPIVFHIRGVEKVRDRLKAMVAAAAPDYAGMVNTPIDAMFSQLEGRKLDSLNAAGPVFVAMMQLPGEDGGEPRVAIIAKVTKFADFRDGFLKADERKGLKNVAPKVDQVDIEGNPVFLADLDTWVVATPKKEDAEKLTKSYAGLHEKLAKELAAKFLDCDLSVYVNMAVVNEKHADSIRQNRDMMVAMMGAANPDKSQAEATKKIVNGAFQALLDSRAMVAGLDFRPTGLHVAAQAQFAADSDSGKFLKDQRLSALEQFGKLPAGQAIYTAVDVSPEAMKAMAAMAASAASSEDAAVQKALEAAQAMLAAAGGKAAYGGWSYPMSGLTVQEFDDPAKALAASVANVQALGGSATYMGGMLKAKPDIQANAQEHRGIKLTAIKLQWDLDKMAEKVPNAGEAMKVVYKNLMGEVSNVWVGVHGKRLVQVMAADWPTAQSKLDTYLDGAQVLEKSPLFQATRKQLAAKSSGVFVVDAGPMANVLAQTIIASLKGMPLPFNVPEKFEPVKTDTSYIGISVSMQPERGGLELYVPVTAVQEIKKVIMAVVAGS